MRVWGAVLARERCEISVLVDLYWYPGYRGVERAGGWCENADAQENEVRDRRGRKC